MASTITLKLRTDVRQLLDGRDGTSEDDFEYILAHPEDLALDTLTPRARALALAFHGCPGHEKGPVRLERDALVREGRNFAYIYGDGPEAEAAGAQHQSTNQTSWAAFPADSPLSAAQWLEREVRTWPMDCYPVGPAGGPRLPEDVIAAAAADKAVTRDDFAVFMEEHGCPLSPVGWDTLKNTDAFPAPDRYVDRRPQWHPDTLAPYFDRERELWPVSRVADYLGYTGPSATGTTRKQLSRWGFMPEGRGPGRGGESLYAADQIIAAHTHRPGRGARTDRLRQRQNTE
ncbi:hypothetical protein [Streptomyces sp. NPDC001205]